MGIIRKKVESIKWCLAVVNFSASDKFFNLFQTHFTIQQVGAGVSWRACFKIELELKEKFLGDYFISRKVSQCSILLAPSGALIAIPTY